MTSCQSATGRIAAPITPTAPTTCAFRRLRSSRPRGRLAMCTLCPLQHLDEGFPDALDVALRHLGEEGERDRPRGDVLAHRELPLPVAELLPVVGHEVDRRQVRLAGDPEVAQGVDDVVASRTVVR